MAVPPDTPTFLLFYFSTHYDTLSGRGVIIDRKAEKLKSLRAW